MRLNLKKKDPTREYSHGKKQSAAEKGGLMAGLGQGKIIVLRRRLEKRKR